MPYVAVRPIRFDRDYAIGEIITDGVVDLSRAESLIKMGLILQAPTIPVNGVNGDSQSTLSPDLQTGNMAETGVPTGEPSPTNNSEGTGEAKQTGIYSKNKLNKMNKDEVAQVAADMGIVLEADINKDIIVEAILAAQEPNQQPSEGTSEVE